MSFPRYERYKDSGVEWLGEVPRHWDEKRLKFTVNLIGEKLDADATDLDYMGLEHIESWSGKRIEDENASSEGIAARFLPGDVLFGKLRPYLAKVYLAEHEGLVSTEALVLRPTSQVHEGFLRYYMVSRDFVRIVDSSTYGSKMPRASWNHIGNLPMLLPEHEEQQTIARFLDHKTAQIDALIAKKEALLEKLAEKRTALISHAVTKGLDPQAKMKDSSVEWLGEIPEHWDVVRLRFVVSKIEQGWSPQCENQPADDDEWGVLKVGCVNGERFDSTENKALPNDLEPKTQYEIKSGDILMSRANTKELLGSAALVNEVRDKLILCDKLYRFISGDNISNRYLVHILRSSLSRYQYERGATGASGSMQNIGQDTVKNLTFALPPIVEQLDIEAKLKVVVSRIENTEELAKLAIEKLKEYRSALITQAVTGKIDVRHVETPDAAEKGKAV